MEELLGPPSSVPPRHQSRHLLLLPPQLREEPPLQVLLNNLVAPGRRPVLSSPTTYRVVPSIKVWRVVPACKLVPLTQHIQTWSVQLVKSVCQGQVILVKFHLAAVTMVTRERHWARLDVIPNGPTEMDNLHGTSLYLQQANLCIHYICS